MRTITIGSICISYNLCILDFWSAFYDFWVSCISLIFSFLVFSHESNITRGSWFGALVRSGVAAGQDAGSCVSALCLAVWTLLRCKGPREPWPVWRSRQDHGWIRKGKIRSRNQKGRPATHSFQKKEILCWKVPNMSWRVAQLLNACLGQKVTESQEVGLASLHWSHSSWSHHIRIPWSNSFGKSEDIPTFSQSSCSATDGYNTCIGCGLYGPAWSSPCRENLQSLWLEAA